MRGFPRFPSIPFSLCLHRNPRVTDEYTARLFFFLVYWLCSGCLGMANAQCCHSLQVSAAVITCTVRSPTQACVARRFPSAEPDPVPADGSTQTLAGSWKNTHFHLARGQWELPETESFAPLPVSLPLDSMSDRHWRLNEERRPAVIPEFLILASSTCRLSESGDFGHFSVQLWVALKLCGGPDFKALSVWVSVLPLPLVKTEPKMVPPILYQRVNRNPSYLK